jgi:serine-type D-Ala-D-Ala carboxypeptidase (penicillin-binding protein 5/6)
MPPQTGWKSASTSRRTLSSASMRFLVALSLAFASLGHAAAPPAPAVVGKAWVVADLSSGQTLASHKADERFEPASLTKLMSAYLVFSAMRDKRLAAGQRVTVSSRAARAAGAKMFIDPRRPVSVDELIRGMVVQSANDACIALAEAVAGSEEAFVRAMNKEAARLGMKGTRFMNPSGLPDAQHYSTAQDLMLLTAALIRDFPQEYAQYYSLKEYRYNSITQPNRNRLLWLDPSVDGVKTGHTEAAGYCLISSARRNNRRLATVLLGATSETTRAQESLKLLNWGYQHFEALKLYGANEALKPLEVWKGAAPSVKIGPRADVIVTVPKGEAGRLKAELVSQQPLIAPLTLGQRVGSLRLTFDGKAIGEVPVVTLEPVAAAGLLGRAWDTLRLWIK